MSQELISLMFYIDLQLKTNIVDLEKEVSVTIFPVVRITHLRSSIPVTVKIGPEHMQVITVSYKKKKCRSGKHGLILLYSLKNKKSCTT
jgi:hypothetical protein